MRGGSWLDVEGSWDEVAEHQLTTHLPHSCKPEVLVVAHNGP